MNTIDAEKPNKIKTRERLILTGERLFAENGIDAISLRQVNTEAGQKNSSAIHYHFGSKENLIKEIYEYRMERVNRRRLARLEDIERTGDTENIRALTEALVLPILEESEQSDATYYIPFMAQATGHPANHTLYVTDSSHAEGLGMMISLLRKALPDVPNPLLGQRFGLALDHTIHALADIDKIISRDQAAKPETRALFLSNLIDMIAAGLSSDVSQETKQVLPKDKP